MESRKIVVRAPSWIGDSILALPAIVNLKRNFPESEIWIATQQWVKDLYPMAGLFEGVIPLPDQNNLKNLLRSARNLKEFDFDMGIMFTNSFASALLFYLARIPQRWGYKRDGRSLMLTSGVSVQNRENHYHQAQYYLGLISGLGLKTYTTELNLPLNQAEKTKAKEWLNSMHIEIEKPVVILNPGAFYGPAKRWPASKFSELASLLQQENGAQILITGSAQEVLLANLVASGMSKKPYILAGRTSLPELAAIISVSDLFVTNDSGPMHLANALKIPVVVIFGPTDPLRTGPYQNPYILFHKEAPCWPCSYRECPFDHRCMMNISSQEVFEACQEFLR